MIYVVLEKRRENAARLTIDSSIFFGGILIFGVGSLPCAISPNLGLLLAGRLLQGVGAAMLLPNSLTILGQAFSGEARGRAIGIWASAGAIGSADGPVLGGLA